MKCEIVCFLALVCCTTSRAQEQSLGRDLATDVEDAKSKLIETRDSTEDYLESMNNIEDILWTKVQPYVSILQENLPSIEIGFADIENIQIQINQASSVLVYQAKLQGKELVRHLRHLNATELNLNSEEYAGLAENRDNLASQSAKISTVFTTAVDLSMTEVVLFNQMMDAILEGQSGNAVDEINNAMAQINQQMVLLEMEVQVKFDSVTALTSALNGMLDIILAQSP